MPQQNKAEAKRIGFMLTFRLWPTRIWGIRGREAAKIGKTFNPPILQIGKHNRNRDKLKGFDTPLNARVPSFSKTG
jgi:hypothetical protein